MWKIIKNLISKTKDNSNEFAIDHNQLKGYNQSGTSVSLDEVFASNFNAGGGHFLYCENINEAIKNLLQIIQYEKTGPVICVDPILQQYLEKININYTTDPTSQPKGFSFLNCEFLCAFDGSIMLSSHQTAGRKVEEFPLNFIIWANASQFANNLSDGLQKLRSLKKDNLPSNITCIRGKDMHSFSSIPNAKNIYLLLVDNLS